MKELLNDILSFLQSTGLAKLIDDPDWWKYLLMYAIVGVLVYLAVVKKFEPLLLLPIAFGMFLANLPGAELIHLEYFFDEHYLEKYFFTTEHFNLSMLLDIAKQMADYMPDLADEVSDLVAAYATMPDLADEVSDLVAAYATVADDSAYAALYQQTVTLLSNNISANHLAAICGSYNGGYTYVYEFTNAVSAAMNNLSAGDTTVKALMANAPDWASHLLSSSAHIRYSMIASEAVTEGGLIDILYLGVKLGIYPSLIFMGVGAMTDFSPLISNPKSLLMGAGAQFGVFAAFFFALILGFTPMEAGAIGIIGGADGPTAILVTKELAPQLLGAIAIAAYSYMALIPIIQPPFMKLLTTPEERKIKMTNLRPVSQVEKVVFPILVTLLVVLVVPDAAPLIGFLMLGNLFNVTGVTDRLSKTSQNELCNIVTIFLGVSVGATANATNFLTLNTIKIVVLGLCAFILSTVGGLLTGKVMCKLSGGKINPLIGSAGVSAVPMAARVAQDVGRKEDPSNFLLMHAMGPNVAGVIGSAVAAGVFLSFLR